MRDEHCHILWGVDDGSDSLEESCGMLDAAKAAGFTQILCTPHMRWSDFSQDLVKERFDELVPLAQERGIKLELGYEVYYKTLMKMGLEHAPRFVQEGTNRILIEFNSGGSVPYEWDRTFYKLQSEYGLRVIVAHPERYGSVLDDFDLVYRMKDAGCKIQVSAGDALGGMFNKSAKCAKRIVKEGLCDALVSDAHCVAHYQEYTKAAKKLGW